MHNKWLATLLLLCSLNEALSGFIPLLIQPSRINRRQTNEGATNTQRYVTTNGSQANSASADASFPPSYVPMSKRSYYEILGADATATRTELKKQYVALARLTHPDALIGRSDTSTIGNNKGAEFSEIAQAWKTLSNEKDRRQYDRTLQAEDFKQNVEQVATAMSNTAGPRVKKAFDDFALPFLRRTTVTTVATVSAAVEKLSSKGTNGGLDLGSAVASAMKAREAAGRVVDAMEFLEKSNELELRAAEEIKVAKIIKKNLCAIVDKRLEVSLTTPNSDLSSAEAFKLLQALELMDGSTTVDYPTTMERLTMKHTIEYDINDLEANEMEYFDAVADRTVAVERFRYTQVALKQAVKEAMTAVQSEIEARKALQKAQELVPETKQSVSTLTKEFIRIQNEEVQVIKDVETIVESMVKRQEKVRKALRRKELEMEDTQKKEAGETVAYVTPSPEDESPELQEEVERLRKEERFLAADGARRDEKIARLLSRAAKLRARSDEGDMRPETMFEKNKGDDAPAPAPYVPKARRSHYDILGARPSDTKADIKKQYFALARLTHPDALIGRSDTSTIGNNKGAEFSEIAQAWKTLSNEKDRRQYDRTLQAEDFKQNVEQVATVVTKTAGPRVKKVFDDFAVPFLRRTTVTTVATVSAAVDRLSSKGTNGGLDLGSAVASAMKAREAAGRVVDAMEFLEKSNELEKRAAEETKEAEKVTAELNAIVDKRLRISLTTPNSALSSVEALKLLGALNTIDSVTVMERLSMKHTIEHDIHDLEAIEMEYFDTVAYRTVAVQNFRDTQVALKKAARDARSALKTETDARKALEKAQERVGKTKQAVDSLTKAFAKIQAEEEKVTKQVEAIAESMAKRQEKVRKALRRKEIEVEGKWKRQAGEPVSYIKSHNEEEVPELVEEIKRLRQEERFLAAESDLQEEKIARILSRAAKLRIRAELGNPNQKAAP